METGHSMRHTVLWLIAAAALAIGFLVYRSHVSRPHWNVAPDAQREIEKAIRR